MYDVGRHICTRDEGGLSALYEVDPVAQYR